MFRPDLPISSSDEDLLGRAPFARSLAEALIAYEHKESLVTAIYGPWGSGKSSVINVILQRVSELSYDRGSDDKPLVVRFNPWNYADQNQLVGQFFRSISVALRRPDAGATARKAGEQLDAYAEFFAPLTFIPDPSGLGNIVAVAANAVLKKAGVALVAWGKLKEKDLDKIRRELDALLAKQSRKILVVIDDIDRLNVTEIRQIFQLVKSIGDFPNTIYLLAFDHAIVTAALAQEQGGSGHEYLEKIVQVPFELPAVSSEDVHKVLFSRLDELLASGPSDRWDGNYWGNVFHGGLQHFFASLRDVNRYVNALRLAYPMVAQEVNAVDFLAITALQVFEPSVYVGIRDNKELFAGTLSEGYGDRGAAREQGRSRIDEILTRSTVMKHAQLTDLIARLFPKVETVYQGVGYGSDFLASWRQARRICSPDKFETFFRLSIPSGEISEDEMAATLSLGGNQAAFTESIRQFAEAGRVVRFLERMEDFTAETIPLDHVGSIVAALMDLGDTFPELPGGMFGRDTSMKVMRIIYQLSQRIGSQEERFRVFRDAIAGANQSLYTLVREVGLHGQQHGKRRANDEPADPEEKRSVDAEHLGVLEQLAAEKIELWARDGRLRKHPRLASILYSWREWVPDGQLKVAEFVREMLKTDDGVIAFACAFEGQAYTHTFGDRVGRIEYQVSLRTVEDFVGVQELEPRLRAIARSEAFGQVPAGQQRAVKTFLDTVDGKVQSRW